MQIEQLQKLKFDKIFETIQPCHSLNYLIEDFFEYSFEDLANRVEAHTIKKDKVRITKLALSSYLNLPVVISDKIFRIFNIKNNKILTRKEFVSGMTDLYFGDFETLVKLTFKIFDFTEENKVDPKNIKILLTYMNNSFPQPLLNDIDLIISEFFDNFETLTYENYLNKIESKNSNIFLLMLIFLYKKQPFTEEDLKFFAEIKRKTEKSKNFEKVSDENKFYTNQKICSPTKTIRNQFKQTYSFKDGVKRKNGSNNVLAFDLDKSISLEDKNELNEMMKESFSPVKSIISDNSVNISDEISPTEHFVYKLSENGQLSKYKIILANQSFFTFKFSKSKNMYKFKSLHPLSGYFITQIKEVTKIDDKEYFALSLLTQYGNSMSNIKKIFFSLFEEDIQKITTEFRQAVGYRNLSDFYDIHNVKLGKGQYGVVFQGENIKTKEKVAIKMFEKSNLNLNKIKLIRSEIDMNKFLKWASHPNIITIYDIFEDNYNIYIVMEYVKYGSLQTNLKSNFLISIEHVKSISTQVADGLNFLKNIGIVHRDIKPENIMISDLENGVHVKITDFGLSKVLGAGETASETYGTLVYSAPEILINNPYDHKVDVWSFGILLFYISFGYLPFDNKKGGHIDEIIEKILNNPLEIPNSPFRKFNSYHSSLLKSCLKKKQGERFSIEQVVNCKWFEA